MLALKLPPETEALPDAIARRTGRSTTSHALETIVEHIEDLEDPEIARQRPKDLDGCRSETVPLADLIARHGFDR